MKKFKLLASDYSNIKAGEIYHESMPIDDLMRTVFDYFITHPEDWEEVFDNPKPLHKDTDLGYFAGLAMQGIMSSNDPNVLRLNDPQMIEYAILLAKELIKQLDKEVGNE